MAQETTADQDAKGLTPSQLEVYLNTTGAYRYYMEHLKGRQTGKSYVTDLIIKKLKELENDL